jgi:hypothetical protein
MPLLWQFTRNKQKQLQFSPEWFFKFCLPVQIHADKGIEFVNKPATELFKLINIERTTTSPAYPQPQCNGQVKVFNKTLRNSSPPAAVWRKNMPTVFF